MYYSLPNGKYFHYFVDYEKYIPTFLEEFDRVPEALYEDAENGFSLYDSAPSHIGKMLSINYPIEYRFLNDKDNVYRNKHLVPFFPKTIEIIYNKLPFASIGRIIFFISIGYNNTVHTDGYRKPWKLHQSDFIYFNLTNKDFFLLDNNQKIRPIKPVFHFNPFDYHGVDNTYGVGLRVDGIFNDSVII